MKINIIDKNTKDVIGSVITSHSMSFDQTMSLAGFEYVETVNDTGWTKDGREYHNETTVLLSHTCVTNEHGKELNYEAAINLMDDEIREHLHMEIAPCSDQEFFDAYVKAHHEKYGEDWELSKPNPVW